MNALTAVFKGKDVTIKKNETILVSNDHVEYMVVEIQNNNLLICKPKDELESEGIARVMTIHISQLDERLLRISDNNEFDESVSLHDIPGLQKSKQVISTKSKLAVFVDTLNFLTNEMNEHDLNLLLKSARVLNLLRDLGVKSTILDVIILASKINEQEVC